MKGIDSAGAHLVHVPGWMDAWMDGCVDGSKSHFKDCLQQSIMWCTRFSAFVKICKSQVVTLGLEELVLYIQRSEPAQVSGVLQYLCLSLPCCRICTRSIGEVRVF
jgi:hypothetical protein